MKILLLILRKTSFFSSSNKLYVLMLSLLCLLCGLENAVWNRRTYRSIGRSCDRIKVYNVPHFCFFFILICRRSVHLIFLCQCNCRFDNSNIIFYFGLWCRSPGILRAVNIDISNAINEEHTPYVLGNLFNFCIWFGEEVCCYFPLQCLPILYLYTSFAIQNKNSQCMCVFVYGELQLNLHPENNACVCRRKR